MNKRNIVGAGVIMVLMAIPATLTARENGWGKSDHMSKPLCVERTDRQFERRIIGNRPNAEFHDGEVWLFLR